MTECELADVVTTLAERPVKGWTGPSSIRHIYGGEEKLRLREGCFGGFVFMFVFFLLGKEQIVYECFYANYYLSMFGMFP